MKSLFVIKIGGNVIDNDAALASFLDRLASLKSAWILVHGGGKLATELSARLGIETQMVEGRRVTDQATLDVVTMVYGGLVNKRIVAALQARGLNALGLTGADGDCIRARKREHPTTDYGFVGDVERVGVERLLSLIQSGFLPVIAPLSHDGQGIMLNTNADTIASEVASALASYRIAESAVHLVYCFEKQGVLRDVEDETSVISRITAHDYEGLREQGIIAKGMIPKMDNAFAALRRSVSSVVITNADSIGRLEQDDIGGTRIVLS
ncbi:MAG: acetylglutamate kinase [Candidatus Kapabacteria bacterium]|jgi:acetylglutamate kinase|nr:acetylglutamate kinase [Candidatus Kapabacteria bacterium]